MAFVLSSEENGVFLLFAGNRLQREIAAAGFFISGRKYSASAVEIDILFGR